MENCCYYKYLKKAEQASIETKEIQDLMHQTVRNEMIVEGMVDMYRKAVWEIIQQRSSTRIGLVSTN